MTKRTAIWSGISIAAAITAFAIWLIPSSLLFIWANGFWRVYPWPDKMWMWASYAMAPETNAIVHRWLWISGIVGALPLALCGGIAVRVVKPRGKLRRPLGGGLKPLETGVSDNHGHAAWPTVADMLRRYPGPAPGHGGVVIGEARRIDLEPIKDVPFNSRDRTTWGMGGKAPLIIDDCLSSSPHSLMFVGTGGFKTMNAISTQFHWLGSIVTFDPSCEIGPMVRRWREKMGQRVVCIGYEAEHQGINVLACIQPHKPGASARILSMTASMCGEEPGRKDSNSIFNDAGRNMIACLLAHMMYDEKNTSQPKTIKTLIEGLVIPENEMQKQLKTIHKESNSELARKLAGTVMGIAPITFSGAYFNSLTMVGYLLDGENADMLSGTFDPADVLGGDVSVYIQIPTATLMHVPGVGRVIADSIVNSVIQADGNFVEPILFQADEARLLGAMKSLEVVLTMGRKYGLYVQLIYTSLNDMKRIWTEDGLETWLDLVGWAGYAAVSSKTAKVLSETVGKMAVLAVSEGANQGTSGQGLGMGSRSKGSNQSTHEIGRSLINPDEFKDSRTDELFVFPRTGRPFRCSLAPYFRRPEMVAEIEQTTYLKGKAA
jgi:type IV secretion system protein VirD4